tara:strand:- start:1304 stop:1606 length:303 start_codon:yes stop_codon:yes gene_type:complete
MTTKIKLIADNAVTTAAIADDAITSALIANNSIGIAQLNVSDGTNGQVLKTNGSGTLSFGDDADAGSLLVPGRSANTSVTITTGNITVAARSGNISIGVS